MLAQPHDEDFCEQYLSKRYFSVESRLADRRDSDLFNCRIHYHRPAFELSSAPKARDYPTLAHSFSRRWLFIHPTRLCKADPIPSTSSQPLYIPACTPRNVLGTMYCTVRITIPPHHALREHPPWSSDGICANDGTIEQRHPLQATNLAPLVSDLYDCQRKVCRPACTPFP